jgi:micrococcal nuclease
MIGPAYLYKATVTNIVDGDTIDAVVDMGFRLKSELRLRLLGVNTPELHSKDLAERTAAQNAKKYVDSTVLGKEVVIRTEKADAFGRYLADVFYVNSAGLQRNLNDDLISLGFAVPFKG